MKVTHRHVRGKIGKSTESAGLTQEELGAGAGLHVTYISQLEHDRKSPTLDSLFRICKALGITASSLIEKVEKQ
jgi:transcriptional regulator with XRE-family HTH domain